MWVWVLYNQYTKVHFITVQIYIRVKELCLCRLQCLVSIIALQLTEHCNTQWQGPLTSIILYTIPMTSDVLSAKQPHTHKLMYALILYGGLWTKPFVMVLQCDSSVYSIWQGKEINLLVLNTGHHVCAIEYKVVKLFSIQCKLTFCWPYSRPIHRV